jgi:protein SCO1/2
VALQHEGLPARFLSVTVDPARDDPATLTAFRARHEGDAATWTLATGSPDTLEALGRDGFRLPVQTGRTLVDGMPDLVHSGLFALVDGQGRVRGLYDHADALALDHLRRDVAALRAAAGR